jgi:glycerophosphoryl diester phosphodiesterase
VSQVSSKWPYPLWIAHRGAGKLAPENTLAAFRLGAQYGYRMFECDVKLSIDGVAFLLHDALLERTTNGHGVGGEKTWEHLKLLDAGVWHSSIFEGEPLPSLTEIAQFCVTNGYCLNIEIKPTPGTELLTGDLVAREAARLWDDADIAPLITSFSPDALAAAKKAALHLPRGLLLHTLWSGWEEVATELECSAVVFNYELLNQDLVSQVHSAGWRCLAYTVNAQDIADQLKNWQIDGLITDRIDVFDPKSELLIALGT